jgi:hypothetical protein
MLQIYLTPALSAKGGEGEAGKRTAKTYLTIHYDFEVSLNRKNKKAPN